MIIGCERGDIDQACNPFIGSRGRDDASTVRVTDQDYRAADSRQRPLYRLNIAFGSVEAILGCHHLISLRLKGGITLLKHEPSAQIP